MVIHAMTEEKERSILDTPEGIGLSFEQLTFDTEGNCLPPAYLPTTPPNEKHHDEEPTAEDPLNPDSKPKVRRRVMFLELPVFLMFVALMLGSSVMLNQELYQTCVAVYNYSETECEPLRGIIPKTPEAKLIENRLQPYVARITMTNSIIHNVWPGLLVLFVGPWSDKFGRRPILLATFGAYFVGYTISAILVFFSKALSLNPWFYLLGGLPSTIVGGNCTMMTIVFCYVSDVSDVSSKAKRMFYIDMVMGVGVVTGNILSSYLLRYTNVATVCATCATLVFIALMYIIIFIGESLDVKKTTLSHKTKHFFDMGLIKDLVKTCVAKRPNYGRAIIACTISILMVSNFVVHGEYGVFYLFLRTKFNVTLQQYTYYNATVIAIKMAGCALAFALFRKLFKLPFAAIAMMGLFGCILDHLCRALAQSFWQMYMASFFGLMSGITGPMLQAIVALAVPSSELGKVYSLASCFKTLSPLFAAPLYTYVYNRTLTFYPGFFNFISTGLFVECFLVMIMVNIYERRVAGRKAKADAENGDSEKAQTEKPQTEKPQTEKPPADIKK
ncbi:proton-coupled folate transporter [Zeugodacus cucurbitae]|uniref:proton-coupled folate transporter n=1 Tax=Zeugodacus cucurbitae TaxID=28588 RepID=UPI0023D9208E|nr:proton-coupled folate transporter [Zeugodacus cucurbitae]